MANSELIYAVEDIFLKDTSFKNKFRIPDYQRGYKWTPKNVTKLLDDINGFNSNETDSFYCVQNITINKASVDGIDYYNVVDGQQRLTTIYIILCFLESNENIEIFKEKLLYEIRESTAKFLLTDICTKKCWQKGYTHSPEHMDEYYILEAAKAIKEWFESEAKEQNVWPDKVAFKNKLLHKTKLIVNLLEGGDEEKTFANLNGVKVPLDGADLVRAMLITRSLGSYNTNRDNAELTKQYRIRMGMELDEMALWWSDGEVQKFFARMIPDSFERSDEEPKFDRSAYPIDLLYFLFYTAKKGNVDDFSLDSFEAVLNKQLNEHGYIDSFGEILSFHRQMRDWYENKEIYHYLGYLFANFRERAGSGDKSFFSKIFDNWISAHSKKIFVDSLVQILQKDIVSLFDNTEDYESNSETKDRLLKAIAFNTEFDWYHSKELPYILIMVDVLTCIQSNNMRLPVDYFRVHDEDREHIGCQTPNNEQLSDKEIWIRFIDELKNIPGEENEIKKIYEIISSVDTIDEEIKDTIISNLTKFGLNSIGNLALLDKSVNRGYGNDPYAEKSSAILNNYFNINSPNLKKSERSKNKYIRPHTLKVFVQDKTKTWGPKEIQKCAGEIEFAISQFLNK